MKNKVKKYAEGGLSGIAETANSLMSEVEGIANKINYGDSASTGPNLVGNALGFRSVGGMQSGLGLGAQFPQTARSGLGLERVLGGVFKNGVFYKKGGKVTSASKRADGIAIRGKTRA